MTSLSEFAPATKKARIEIIPLIDVIFFLLATFVLFPLSLSKVSSIPIELPRAGGGEDHGTIFLQVSEPGTYYWQENQEGAAELIALAEIGPRLARHRQLVGEPRVLIRGDTRAKFGLAVQALDEVRAAGVTRVSIETRVSPTPR